MDVVKEWLLYAQLIAAAQRYTEYVFPDPVSVDLSAIFAWAFAPWTGGPISYIDTIGVVQFVRTAESLAHKHGAL